MGFPQWTDILSEEGDAIQFLRLNELRDHINRELFPYLTTITPYYRMVSWLSWIYTKLYKEIQSKEIMNYPSFINHFKKYYSVFSVSNILYADANDRISWGPIGVIALREQLQNSHGKSIDFKHPKLADPINPTPNYRTSLMGMKLLDEKTQPIGPRTNLSILVPTPLGEQLAEVFQRQWEHVITPEIIMNDSIFSKETLCSFGEMIFLQGLEPDNIESSLLIQAVNNTFGNELQVNDLIEYISNIGKRFERFSSSDVSESTLYGEAEIEGIVISVSGIDSETRGLLAFHELHTHFSYGADAILNSIVDLSRGAGARGINPSQIIKKAIDTATWLNSTTPLKQIYDRVQLGFREKKSKYLVKIPPRSGEFGFKTYQSKVEKAISKEESLFYASLILLQSCIGYKSFNEEWLNRRLIHHKEVFSAYSMAVEYESLSKEATIEDWIRTVVFCVLEQHDLVSGSKGAYSKRFNRVSERIEYLRPADFAFQRGRLLNAVTWVSDLGYVRRSFNDYSVEEEI